MRTLLAVAVAALLSACSMGDIANGPSPVNVTVEQITGAWDGHDNAGTFTFAADGTLTASDLPADALPPIEPTQRWSCTGIWRITSPLDNGGDQRNMVRLGLWGLAGVDGGHGEWMSASKQHHVIVLTMGNYWYTKEK